MPHPAALPVDELLRDCEVVRTRRGGPGGQHRNKVETAVVITHRPSGAIGEASERRSQDLNRQAAIHRLRLALALAVRSPVCADQPPSELWRSRTRGRKVQVSTEHADFPALLAEVLDRLAASDWDAAKAATALGISRTQLVRFLKQQPEALAILNRERALRGLLKLK
jgi:hypothetical protein